MVDRAPQDDAASQKCLFRPAAQSFGSIPMRGQWDSRRNSLTALGAKVVSRIFTRWNHLDRWLRQIDGLQTAA
jgi:hypothetical protein